MIQIKRKEQCCGCSACESICPVHCIQMKVDEEGFSYPAPDPVQCIECGACVRVCPVENKKKSPDAAQYPDAFAAINRDEETRRVSSSGGVFSLLAEQVLADGGVVFGAVWDEGCRSVYHTGIESAADLHRMQGSKYLQSEIRSSYCEVRDHLRNGRQVLFSGTPCQVAGLKAFLGAVYENLICVDLICHGAPSPKVWRQYLMSCEQNHGCAVGSVSLRSKITGWKGYSVELTFADGHRQSARNIDDYFMKAFLADVCLRPACYACAFKGLERDSDLTLADFWGIERVVPELDDDRGTSLVLLHSEKGHRVFARAAQNMDLRQVDAANALQFNSAMTRSVSRPGERQGFFADLDTMPFAELVKTYVRPTPLWKRAAQKSLRILKRMRSHNK